MPTLLITGFGPFPGAPYNPTAELVEQLTSLRRPVLEGMTIVGHVFETSYAAVDRDLPALLARYQPDALLMLGLAARTNYIRIETRVRNALAQAPDVSGTTPQRRTIAPAGPPARTMPSPQRRLLAAARASGVPVRLSRDAGDYLCNYLCWHATEASGLTLAAFVHVPLVTPDTTKRQAANKVFTASKLQRVGTRLVLAMAATLSGPLVNRA